MILVDDRIGSKELFHYFPPGTARLSRLEYADFAFFGLGPNNVSWRVGIERKTIRDLLACIRSGRFSGHQLKGLLNGYNEVYLIIEGLFKGRGKDGLLITWENADWAQLGLGSNCYMMRDVWLFLNTIAIKTGIRWNVTTNPRETARFVSTLHRWWSWKEYGEHRAHLQPDTGRVAQVGNHTLVRRLASHLKGVGWEKSKAVEAEFDSISDMCAAGEERWKEIDGIGKKLSQSIVNELRGEN